MCPCGPAANRVPASRDVAWKCGGGGLPGRGTLLKKVGKRDFDREASRLVSAPSGDSVGPLAEEPNAGLPADAGLPAQAGLESVASLSAHSHHPVAPGETLQRTRYIRRGSTHVISGLTPHGRRLTFEQSEGQGGWHVVVAGRRRRPTERELGLVVASIAADLEAATAPEVEDEVRSAYRLATTSDQPGIEVYGLPAYRNILIDEAAAYQSGQNKRLAVVAVHYQAFKRFAIRHGHRVGAAFVRALGERLALLFRDDPDVEVFHKTGKQFRLIIRNRSSRDIHCLVQRVTSDETRGWLVSRVWGNKPRTHPAEVHFYVGIATATPFERQDGSCEMLAQRLNDDAYRAAKLGQLRGHPSIVLARSSYETAVYQWRTGSEEELEELESELDEGPGEVRAEMQDYLHELIPVDLEGMAVEGDLSALIHAAIARDGFWQGTTAMRLAGERLLERFMSGSPTPAGQNSFVGGFDLGDEFYGVTIEDGLLHFLWGDLNSAGATRVQAGLEAIHHAAGWRRVNGGGIVGRFLRALGSPGKKPLVTRIREEMDEAHEELRGDPRLRVRDTVDIADYLWTSGGQLVEAEDLVKEADLRLKLPGREFSVRVTDRRSVFMAQLEIEGQEVLASVSASIGGPSIKLRIRDAVLSAAVCVLSCPHHYLESVFERVRADYNLGSGSPMDRVGFMRHIADILLAEQVKGPGKIQMALGLPYASARFVKAYRLEDVQSEHPGLFFEAVHQNLVLEAPPPGVDPNLTELIVGTMLERPRPQ